MFCFIGVKLSVEVFLDPRVAASEVRPDFFFANISTTSENLSSFCHAIFTIPFILRKKGRDSAKESCGLNGIMMNLWMNSVDFLWKSGEFHSTKLFQSLCGSGISWDSKFSAQEGYDGLRFEVDWSEAGGGLVDAMPMAGLKRWIKTQWGFHRNIIIG